MKVWKAIGLAGLAGVAATGVIIARDERRRSKLTPDEVRARLQERLASESEPGPGRGSGEGEVESGLDVQ